jgi:hypothetical protein
VRRFVVVAAIGLMTGSDLGPGEPPPLYEAVSQAGDVRAKRLLDEGSDPNQTYEGVPVLHQAAVVGSVDAVRVLLVAGADPALSVVLRGTMAAWVSDPLVRPSRR